MNSNICFEEYASCRNSDTICTVEYEFCKKAIKELELEMHLIQVNFIREENKHIFFFTAPKRVDFRKLLKILRKQYYGSRIELRQIGNRDAASLLGGIGICGRELCCCTFLKTFYPITAKVAKKVGATPNPAMYCGVCSRLRCCLKYEENNGEVNENNLDDNSSEDRR